MGNLFVGYIKGANRWKREDVDTFVQYWGPTLETKNDFFDETEDMKTTDYAQRLSTLLELMLEDNTEKIAH